MAKRLTGKTVAHFSHNREGLIEGFVLIQIIVKSRDERP